MIEIAGGIILGFLGLGVVGMLLSIDWSSSPTPPAPILSWTEAWQQTTWGGLILDVVRVGFFLFILVYSVVNQVLYGPLPVTRALMNWLGL